MSDFDPAIWATARQRLPLPHLMTKMGDGAHTRKGAKCPFCSAGDHKWALFERNGRHLFKCHKPGCVANDPPSEIGHNEVGYIALRRGIPANEAGLEYLKMAVPDVLDQQERERKSKDGKKSAPPPPNEVPPGKVIPISSGQPPPKKNPWNELWKRLILNSRDRLKLRSQRGFSDQTIDKLGFRTNNHSNRVHIEALLKDFSMDTLLGEGIFKTFKGEHRPNPQLLGWGLAKRGRKDGEKDTWDWAEPILIPYLDENGEAFYLRPHKGGVSKPFDEDEEDHCSAHVYCPFLLSQFGPALEGRIVLCEGEFKADALFQCGIPALAIPGISFVRNRAFRTELINILRRFGISDMVICFDNEVKDDPKFAERYKPDPFDRWDTPMWAEYIAIDLGREYFGPNKGTVRIGILPDELLENGKADFDSALSSFVTRRRDVGAGTEDARKVFTQLIEEARPHRQARELFPSESRRIIECKLQRLFYKPLVSSGSDDELKHANDFALIGEKKLADAFRSIIGCYYDRKAPERSEFPQLMKNANAASERTKQARLSGLTGTPYRKLKIEERAAWEHVKGMPIPISDFTLSCEFKLHAGEGKVVRLVRIRNRSDSGKSDSHLIRLTGAEMARGPEFMRFCYDSGRACWKGGQRKLADLCEDMDHHSYYRDIFEVNYYGYHSESGMWFFGDCAFNKEGDLIAADENNIFWNGGIGYQVDSSVDERGTTFEQGAPLLLAPHSGKKEDREVAELFNELCQDLFYTIGGYDAWLMLGLIFAYAAAPELLRLGGHPGNWLYGKMSGGKTTIARWIMRIWGFKDLNGVGIDDRTTPVGMNRFLAQYSCLPVWFDEYRSNHNDPQKEAVLRGAFDRNSGAKGLADHSNRTRSARIHTTPLVTGEASSSDAATRSRYGHINVNDRRRIGDSVTRYIKVQADCRHYYLIGRFLMQNRPKFVEQMLERQQQWMQDEEVRARILNERVRFVYGTAWSAFVTLSRAMSSPATQSLAEERFRNEPDFKEYLYSHGEQALQDVISETFLTRFWTDVLSGIQRGKIKRPYFQIRTVVREPDGHLSVAQAADEGSFQVCYIASNIVFDDYAQDMRARGETPALDLGDLRREMAKEPYWIPPPKPEDKNGARVHRIAINGSKTTCWVISLVREAERYLFPFAEDLINLLNPDEAKDMKEANDRLDAA